MASRPDAAAVGMMGRFIRRPINLIWLDIAEEPVWVTDAPYSLQIVGTGDEDLDGKTFSAVDPRFIAVGPVKQKETGTDTVTLKLSGLPSIDDELMTTIGNKANWQGRDVRLWRAMLNPENLQRVGTIWAYHTGFMNVPKITGDSTSQMILLETESYFGLLGQASGGNYLQQSLFDPGDRSADLAIALANGSSKRK